MLTDSLCVKLAERAFEESMDARNYAKWATKLKMENPAVAEILVNISTQELNHMDALQKEAVKVSAAHNDAHKEVIDYLHEKQMEFANEARNYQSIYRS